MERGRPTENNGKKDRKSGLTILHLTLTPVQQGTRRKSTLWTAKTVWILTPVAPN